MEYDPTNSNRSLSPGCVGSFSLKHSMQPVEPQVPTEPEEVADIQPSNGFEHQEYVNAI